MSSPGAATSISVSRTMSLLRDRYDLGVRFCPANTRLVQPGRSSQGGDLVHATRGKDGARRSDYGDASPGAPRSHERWLP